MSQPVTITSAFLDRILGLLAPLFMAATGGDVVAARAAADTMLANYRARTDDELRLVALTIAFGFGALDALGRAADADLSLNQIIRLRGNATALSRAGHQNQATLDKRRKEAAAEPPPEPEPKPEPDAANMTLPETVEPAALLAFARAAGNARPQPTTAAIVAAPLSRQQRRAAERKAEKARRRQEHQARCAARLAVAPTRNPLSPEPVLQSVNIELPFSDGRC